MTYDLQKVAARLAESPATAVTRWEQSYRDQVTAVAEQILLRRNKSPVVLLAGPSGSGKTTTAIRLRERLIAMGHRAHLISMDNYFRSWTDPDFPRFPDGSEDLENPDCMDTPLLEEHFSQLEAGECIYVPIYDFPSHRRLPDRLLRLDAAPGDLFIFEGIHALNRRFTLAHPDACRVYVSPEGTFAWEDRAFSPQSLRLTRRLVRDYLFRGATVEYSLTLWGNVVSSEGQYVTPYRETAHCRVDTTLAYEPAVLLPYVGRLLANLPGEVPCREAVEALRAMVPTVPSLSSAYVPEDSILREFIGHTT